MSTLLKRCGAELIGPPARLFRSRGAAITLMLASAPQRYTVQRRDWALGGLADWLAIGWLCHRHCSSNLRTRRISGAHLNLR